jgi:hypothetical protein
VTVVTAIARSSHSTPEVGAAEIDFHLPMSWGIGGITAVNSWCVALRKSGPGLRYRRSASPMPMHLIHSCLTICSPDYTAVPETVVGDGPCCRRGFWNKPDGDSDTVCRSGPCPRSSRLSHFTRPETVHARAGCSAAHFGALSLADKATSPSLRTVSRDPRDLLPPQLECDSLFSRAIVHIIVPSVTPERVWFRQAEMSSAGMFAPAIRVASVRLKS